MSEENRLEGILSSAFPNMVKTTGHTLINKPLRREWQGLTPTDRVKLKEYWRKPGIGPNELIEAVEQALKEKNSG